MSTKKSLPITAALILVIALASLGVAYGYWTDSVVINGTVETGEFEVEFVNLWWSDTNCTYEMDPTSHALTISAANAYPGFWCEGSVEIKNTGTIPVKVMPAVSSQTGPDYWDIYPYAAAAVILQPGETGSGTLVEFLIPATETGNEGMLSTLTVTFEAKQVDAP